MIQLNSTVWIVCSLVSFVTQIVYCMYLFLEGDDNLWWRWTARPGGLSACSTKSPQLLSISAEWSAARKTCSTKCNDIIFTIIAEILVHSLANFYCQIFIVKQADRPMNFNIMCQWARADNLTICYHKKHVSVLLSKMNFVTTLSKSSVDPQLLWQNSCSITGQMHEKLTSICEQGMETAGNQQCYLVRVLTSF